MSETFYLKRTAPEEHWHLVVDDQGVVLEAPDGETEASFSRDAAERRFKLPGLFESRRQLGIRNDQGRFIWFVRDNDCVTFLKDYLEDTLAAKGSGALSARRMKGWLFISLGFALVAFGLIFGVLTVLAIVYQVGGPGLIFPVLAIVGGLILASRGVGALTRARGAARKLAMMQAGDGMNPTA